MTVVVVDALRTPRGKAKPSGGLAGFTALELTAQLLGGLVERTGLDPRAVDDVVIGCATQTGEQGGNLGKTAALWAGWPAEVPGMTLNRFCASGLEAVLTGAAKIASGQAELVVAGGVESVSRVPMFADGGPLYTDPRVVSRAGFVHMGVAADLVATLEGIERGALDAYAVRSHERAARAWADERFAPSLFLPRDDQGHAPLATDEHVRPDTSVAALAEMPAAFEQLGAAGQDGVALARYPEAGPAIRHVHHRGNSPALADGAGAVLLASAERARALGLPARARLRAGASASVDPVIMLTAGQQALERAVAGAGLSMGDIGRVEFAEAFAALAIKCQRDLDLHDERFNVNGGTIAMGHAFGATGAILVATLLDELEHSGERWGLVGISGAAGVGAAALFERA